MHGHLQTKAYATETFRLAQPGISDEKLDRLLVVRMQRHGLLTRRLPPAPRVDIVLNEATLRRAPGSRDAMAAQLAQVADVAALPNVSVRVLPFAAGMHRAMSGSFVILDFPPGPGGRDTEPTTVYCENVTGALYLDKPAEIAAYAATWHDVVERSLDEAASLDLIAAIAKEF
jgi:hypothetical protein